MIEINNLHIGYTDDLLKIGQLNLEKGQVYALVGKNGSGKSTFLKTLSAQIAVRKGEVIVDQKLLSAYSIKEIPTKICFVPSVFPEIEFMKVTEFIAFGRSPYTGILGKLSESDKVIVNNAIDRLQIAHLKNRFTSELSDGEKQLVSLARAVAQETPYIILDEPTSFLDYSNKAHVINILMEIAKELKKTIVFSSHDIDLCIAKDCRFLVITNIKEIKSLTSSVSKNEILSLAFPELVDG